MTEAIAISIWISAPLMSIAGFCVGHVYFWLMRRTVTAITSGLGWSRPFLLTFLRALCVIVLFFPAIKLGALPMLAALAGFLIARKICVSNALRGA